MCEYTFIQCEPGPDSSLGERELEAAFKALTEIRVSLSTVYLDKLLLVVY